MEKDGYTYSGMTCTCRKGKEKERTSLGRESGCYTKYLLKGYTLQKTYEPTDGAQFYKREHMTEDMEIQMAYNKYVKKHGEEPKSLVDFYIPKKEKNIMRQYLSLEDAKKHGGKDVWPCGPSGKGKSCGEIYNFFLVDGDKKIDSYKCKQEHLRRCEMF
ncbi:unnamed protein product [marine sediment metagenome]|uniref:Uncharacterized protein n=1 Tax=marine sediment metagenome TaxID=412755 RepID=X0TZE6_9ZZZZ